MTSVINQNPFLRTTREFPEESYLLSLEVNRSYVDIANAVNSRTISLFPTQRSANTGESWYLDRNFKQQTLRQVYTFTSSADIPIGFKFSTIDQFSHCYGSFTDGTNFYGVIYGSSVVIAGQLSFFLFNTGIGTSTDVIRFRSDGATPTIQKGLIVLEWISQK